jgi:hypothetical protein
MPGEFERLRADPYAEVIVAATIVGHVAGVATTWRIASAAGVYTEPDENPANAVFDDSLLQGWRTERRVSESGVLVGGKSDYNRGELYLDNSDGRYTAMLDADFSQGSAELRLGGRLTLDGFRFPYAEFIPALIGDVESVTPQPDAVLKLTLAGTAAGLDDALVQATYQGFGSCLSFDGSGDWVDFGDILDKGATDSFEVEIRFRSESVGTEKYLVSDRTSGAVSAGWRAFFNSLNQLLCSVSDGVAQVAITVDGLPYLDGSWHRLSVSVDREAQTLRLLVDGVELAESSIAAIGSLSNAITTRVGSRGDGASSWNGDLDDFRMWSAPQDDDDRLDRADRPLTPTEAADCDLYAKFNEGIGTDVFDDSGNGNDGAITGATWAPTYEGDDPEQFEGSLMGAPKGRSYGEPKNVSLANTDSQRHLHQWDEGESEDIYRLYESRVPLFPDETITAGAGELVFSAAAQTITLGGSLSAHRFVPGQTDPVRTGMTFDVTGTGSNNGKYTVAADGISADGKTITTVEALVDETTAGTLRTASSDRHYTYDLVRSVVDLPSAPAGQLTADVAARLGAGGTLRASELFEMVAGEAPDISDLEVDPVVSFNSPPGASTPPTPRDVMDGAARSAMAAWWELRGGGYKMATWRLPSGDPVQRFPSADVDSVAGLEVSVPSWRLTVAWSPNWTEQDPGSLPGSVTPADRDFAAAAFRFIPRTLIPVGSRSRLSKPLEPILTWCADRSEVEQLMAIAKALYTGQRRWWEIGLTGVAPLTLDLWDVIYVTYDEPGSGLESGRLVRVVRLVEETGSDLVLAEVFA